MIDLIYFIVKDPVLILTTSLTVILTAILGVLLIPYFKYGRVKSFIDTGIGRMNEAYNERKLINQVKRYSTTIKIRMNPIERIELKLIDKSNIRRYIPFFNFYMLTLISLTVFFLSFQPVYRILFSVPSTIIICLLLASLPFLILEVLGRYNSEKVRRKLANFVNVLNRWCSVKEDIIYAFEKSINSGIGEPLRTFFKDRM